MCKKVGPEHKDTKKEYLNSPLFGAIVYWSRMMNKERKPASLLEHTNVFALAREWWAQCSLWCHRTTAWILSKLQRQLCCQKIYERCQVLIKRDCFRVSEFYTCHEFPTSYMQEIKFWGMVQALIEIKKTSWYDSQFETIKIKYFNIWPKWIRVFTAYGWTFNYYAASKEL